jgi:hypothetical protein
VGQKNKMTRRWARRGTGPSAPSDRRTASTYIFGAICPREGKAVGLILSKCNIETMQLRPDENLQECRGRSPRRPHARQGRMGVHRQGATFRAISRSSRSRPNVRKLNPVESIWEFMRDNWLSNRIFFDHDDIVDHCCDA